MSCSSEKPDSPDVGNDVADMRSEDMTNIEPDSSGQPDTNDDMSNDGSDGGGVVNLFGDITTRESCDLVCQANGRNCVVVEIFFTMAGGWATYETAVEQPLQCDETPPAMVTDFEGVSRNLEEYFCKCE